VAVCCGINLRGYSVAIVFAFFWLNLRHALLNGGVPTGRGLMPRALLPTTADGQESELTLHLLHSAIVFASLAIAGFAANAFFTQWDYLAALPLRRRVRHVRSAAWDRRRILCVSAAILSDAADQRDALDRSGHWWRRHRLSVFPGRQPQTRNVASVGAAVDFLCSAPARAGSAVEQTSAGVWVVSEPPSSGRALPNI